MSEKWTLVQHSGYGYAGKPGFKQGLEVRSLNRKNQLTAVTKAGGMLFDSYMEAHDMMEKLMYPEDYTGIYPQFRGTFSSHQVDGLRVAIPLREVVA